MATLGATNMTLADRLKLMDPNGQPARIIEALSQTNAILDDMTWKEGNLPTGHRTTIRTGLATAYWRLLNQGTSPSKGTTAQVTVSTGILESLSKVDVEVAKLGGDPAAARLAEGVAHLQGITQEFASTLFYGNSTTAPQEFHGLAIQYSDLTSTVPNSQNIIDAGGNDNGDNSSIWLIGWGDDKVSGLYPKGSTVGVDHQDYGIQIVPDATGIAGAVLPAYVDLWQWKCGVIVEDWRYAILIANIDMSAIIAESGNADLTKLMTKAVHRAGGQNGMGGARWAFYMNRTIAEYLDIQRQAAVSTGGQLSYGVVDGKWIMSFRGIPIRTVDALLETEDDIT